MTDRPAGFGAGARAPRKRAPSGFWMMIVLVAPLFALGGFFIGRLETVAPKVLAIETAIGDKIGHLRVPVR
jgi:hypothetical protein